MPGSGSRWSLALAILWLGSTPVLAQDTDTDTDTDTDVPDTDDTAADTGSDSAVPSYAAHDLAGEDGGSACFDGSALGWVLVPFALALPAWRRE